MVDEKLVIEKIEYLKSNVEKILKKPYMVKYMTPDQFCYLMDKLIGYINDIEVDGVYLDKDEYQVILEYMGQGQQKLYFKR